MIAFILAFSLGVWGVPVGTGVVPPPITSNMTEDSRSDCGCGAAACWLHPLRPCPFNPAPKPAPKKPDIKDPVPCH